MNFTWPKGKFLNEKILFFIKFTIPKVKIPEIFNFAKVVAFKEHLREFMAWKSCTKCNMEAQSLKFKGVPFK